MVQTRRIVRGHSTWSGCPGRTCTLSWCTLRKWNGSRVVYEYHYDEQQNASLSQRRSRVRVPSSQSFFPKELARFCKICAIHKKI